MSNACCPVFSAAVLALCFSNLGLAQSAPPAPSHNLVFLDRVKSDMVNEWIDLQKNELMPAQKKAGVTTRTTYQTILGNTNEYLTVTPLGKYSLLDESSPRIRALGAEGAARLTAKLQKCVESSQMFITNSLPELSYAAGPGLPALAVFTRVRVAPGRLQEYQDLVKSEITRIYKKANQGYTVTRRGLGANNNDITSLSWLNKMADIDSGSPVTQALGPDGAAKLQVKAAGMGTMIEQVVRRKIPELSY